MASTVVVVGGGYGGIGVAKALDDVADVTLVEPRETFVHNVAALRAATRPLEWAEQLFIPYDGLLSRGRVVRDRVVRASAGEVVLATGAVLRPDFLVLATGSGFPFPAKIADDDRAGALARIHAVHDELTRASGVLLLGAGPVGLEFAGEIRDVWPDKPITVVDPAADLVSGRFPDDFRKQLQAQLDQLGVRLHLGETAAPPTEPARVQPFTVTTGSGAQITADIWFPCFGAAPNTAYLAPDLSAARLPNGLLAVTPELRLPGSDTVFAVGDITATPEMKQARLAQLHAEVVAANIRAAIEGRPETVAYQPEPDGIVLPLGPSGGVSYSPEVGVLGAEATADIKRTFFIEMYLDLLGQPVRA